MTSEWYVAVDGCQKGPLSTTELKRWIQEGKVARDTFVREGANGPWTPVSQLHFAPDSAGSQILLNLIGTASLLVIGVEVFLFLWANPLTASWAPAAVGLYLVVTLYQLPKWLGKKPAKSS
jgi:hypothetical protein